MEYYDIKKLNQYIETVKVVRPSVEQKLLTKILLNSYYGKMISSVHFIDGKDKNMDKDYIVVHGVDSNIGIVFKDKIVGVFKETEGDRAKLLGVNGYMLETADKYEDIIKQII